MLLSPIQVAIQGMTADQIVAYLSGLTFSEPDPPPMRPELRAPYLSDPGLGFQPGTFTEVEYLWHTDVIDVATYLTAKANYRANIARVAASRPQRKVRRDAFRSDAERERHPETGLLPEMVCKGLLRETKLRPYVLAWAPGAIWALNADAASEELADLIRRSVGRGFPATPTSAEVRLDLEDKLSVAACVARSTTLRDMEGGPIFAEPLPPGCIA